MRSIFDFLFVWCWCVFNQAVSCLGMLLAFFVALAVSVTTLNIGPLQCDVISDARLKFHVQAGNDSPGSRELL